MACTCLPLFVGLDRWDLQNDEAIYSYAVDRMLGGAGWATPRGSPFGDVFLEKPPLKLWMVAGSMDAGLLPHNEFGMRFLDALLGSVALLYVYALGVSLAGPACGVVATLVLFLFAPLVFEHGLRSNNMEAALLLCQTGGLYHFARWVEAGAGRRARGHALAVAGYFTLGFMTKFVAAFFLPLVAVAALVMRRDGLRRVLDGWRDWVLASVLAIAAIAPWFIYQMQHTGDLVWRVMLGQHVYTRFTSALDPSHLEPWSFYFTETWRHLGRAGTNWLVLAGLVAVAVSAWNRKSWLARLLLVWAVLPMAALSFGTSKLLHYVYPFLPPLGLAAGYAAALWIRAARHAARRAASQLLGESTAEPASTSPGRARLALSATEGYAAALSVLALLAVLPLSSYRNNLAEARSVASPLRAVRDCGVALLDSHAGVGVGFYNAASEQVYHSYFYYLRRLGPWRTTLHPEPEEMRRRLAEPGHQTPVLLTQKDYNTLSRAAGDGGRSNPVPAASSVAAVAVGDGIVVLLPGAYERCVQPAVAAGARQAADTGGAS